MTAQPADTGAAPALPWPALPPWQAPLVAEALAGRASWPHALLISGPRGIGKHALALHLAQALLCETPHADGSPCGQCPGCRYAIAGQHPDLMRLELTTFDESTGEWETVDTIAVDRVRALIDFVLLSSHRQRAKVAVIAPAERMHVSAANALLKTLEEPPPGTFVILVSDQPGRLPATIVSRCRMLPVPLPPESAALAWLAAQGVAAPAAALAQAGGAPLLALSHADAATQAERKAWQDALSRSGAPAGDRARAAHRRGGARRAQGAPRAGGRLDDRVDRRPRARRRRQAPRGAIRNARRRSPRWRRGWRRSSCFAIIDRYCGNARSSRTR